MSKSLRLNDELFEQAKKIGKVFHRSPPQQIEHWAQIGRVLESALSYQAVKGVSEWGEPKDIDDLMDWVASSAGKKRARQVIEETSS